MQVSKLSDLQIKDLTALIEDQYTNKKYTYPIYRKIESGSGTSGTQCTSYLVPLEWGISNNFIFSEKFNENKIKIKDSSIELRTIQKKCMIECDKQFKKRHGGGIINLSTSSGKTVISLYLIGKYKYRTLILVNTIELIEQWTSEIKKFLPDATIGRIRGNEFDINKDIVLATVQSVSKKYSKETFNIFSLVFIDEVHHLSSKIFSEALYKTRVKYTFGLSATIERKDKLEYIFKWHLGDVIFSNLDKSKQDTVFVKLNYNVNKKEITIYNGKPNISAMITELSKDSARNKLITDYLFKILKKENKRKILVLSDRVLHLHVLHSILGPEISGLYTGKTSELEKIESKTKSILLATYQIASEGFNHPVLNTLLFATPRSSVSQSIGRIYRKVHDIKPIIIDVVDSYSIFPYQYRKRLITYKKELNFKDKIDDTEECLFE